jgi:uncharacterized membrane protein YuzA (DUF378 family)
MNMRQNLFYVALILVLVGALNWTAHAFNMNLVAKVGNADVEKGVYIAVGVAALYIAYDVVMNMEAFNKCFA